MGAPNSAAPDSNAASSMSAVVVVGPGATQAVAKRVVAMRAMWRFMFTVLGSLQVCENGFLLMRPDFSAVVRSGAECVTEGPAGPCVAGLQQTAKIMANPVVVG